jgi:hypothetical protein
VQITDTVDAATLSCRPTTSGRTWYADGGLSCPTLNQPGDGDGDGANTCFIDECVPPGTWRYGIAEWADPNACEKSVRTNYAWAPAVVTDPVDGCVRSKTTTAPATWTGKMTWTDDRVACSKSYNPLGCSTVGAVLPMHFLAFLGGLAWLIHRRRLASP